MSEEGIKNVRFLHPDRSPFPACFPQEHESSPTSPISLSLENGVLQTSP